MIIKEIRAKTILSASKIYDYVINPYVGCEHGCSYCYARYIKKFTGHYEPWGGFVDVKVNAPELLKKEILKKKKAMVWISGLCDPYQPPEAHYELTRQCLEVLAFYDWPVSIQTRSALVLRDLDMMNKFSELQAGFSIPTADDSVRMIFEPHATPVGDRISALEELHRHGITTYAMIAPVLPGAENLVSLLAGKVDHILVDRMNYRYAEGIYKKHGLESKMTDDYFAETGMLISEQCRKAGIACRVVF
ncbi:MAG TPA: radical SAM protein [Bacteroidales bacterium]|mgnify:CR=1 FL=1|nr:radical SAM protein [Bacteroidales bacterium]HOX79340.1 radical SAM protein [Bacteroidales bacterium]HPI86704.1 radical SAM protein [Bacteroidales bacterium]HPM93146.1 radical SAM protein [Bacteroidales bacterium]